MINHRDAVCRLGASARLANRPRVVAEGLADHADAWLAGWDYAHRRVGADPHPDSTCPEFYPLGVEVARMDAAAAEHSAAVERVVTEMKVALEAAVADARAGVYPTEPRQVGGVTYRWMSEPDPTPRHPNCRCAVVPVRRRRTVWSWLHHHPKTTIVVMAVLFEIIFVVLLLAAHPHDG